MSDLYNYKNCQSLFGYAEEVHKRSGGICQLCGCGSGDRIDFNLWRQFTVEHLIGKTQKGYWDDINKALHKRFPRLSDKMIEEKTNIVDNANTVTACSFCNSTTSRHRHSVSMEALINKTSGNIDKVVNEVVREIEKILKKKRQEVKCKLQAVRKEFDEQVNLVLEIARRKRNNKKSPSH